MAAFVDSSRIRTNPIVISSADSTERYRHSSEIEQQVEDSSSFFG
jgi:hypothetical protein